MGGRLGEMNPAEFNASPSLSSRAKPSTKAWEGLFVAMRIYLFSVDFRHGLILDGFADHQDRAVDRIQLAGHRPPPKRFPQPRFDKLCQVLPADCTALPCSGFGRPALPQAGRSPARLAESASRRAESETPMLDD
jgi:hypothetical protein